MRKVFFLCSFLFFIYTYSVQPATAIVIENENEIVIVEVEDHQLEFVLHEIKIKFPQVQVRQLYKETFYGLSIKGSPKDIDAIQNMKQVKSVVPVATYSADLNESVPFIGVQQLRKNLGDRYTGKGIKVGVIDTGVDYNHPDLKGNYGGGYDTIDNDKDPMETTKAQGVPTIHGTHVAGIIAANGKMKGVAPDATIIAYRALGPGGRGTTESVIAAIEQAVKDEVNILNLSLGNDVNGPDWPTSIALNKAVDKGIVAITASGNSGPQVWTIGSPGTATKAISVGASMPPLKMGYLDVLNRKIKMFPLQGTDNWKNKKEEKIVFGGIGREDEIKRTKGKIILIQRGEITFSEKVQRAKEKGATGVIIYNNEPGLFMGKVEPEISIPAVSISKEDGEWLKEILDKKNLRIKTVYRQEQDQMADFSSRGPVTTTWEVKPDVVAPGVSIYSTVPGGYKSLQGTSMASPHVAGAAAVLMEAHPDWTPLQIKAALMNTAKVLKKHSGAQYHVYEQGAGRIQLYDAINTKSLLYPSSLSFGIISKKEKVIKKTLYIEVENVIGRKNVFSLDATTEPGVVLSFPKSFDLKGKQKGQIPVEITVQTKKLKRGMHEGRIYVKDIQGTKSIPYLFMVEEPNYPRAMGLQFKQGDEFRGKIGYEIYLPQGAEEVGIFLYEPLTMFYIGTIDYEKDIPRGLYRASLDTSQIPGPGIYKVIVFAKKKGKEEIIERLIKFGK